MLNLRINKKFYKYPENWGDIDLATAVELSKVCGDMPDILKQIYAGEEVKLTKKQEIKVLPTFFGNVMAVLTDVPADIIAKCNWEYRTGFYQEWLNVFVAGILFRPDIEPKGIKYFKHKGIKYLLPLDKNVLGSVRPMAEEQAIAFTESVDLELHADNMKQGKLEVMANIISIICRPKGEEYDEETSLKRAEEFMDLPMDVVWEVFFYLNGCMKPLDSFMEIYSRVQGSSHGKQQLIQA